MNILVEVASRHGSTYEIADTIAQELRESGHSVDVQHAGETRDVGSYDAAIIGSAVYMGAWLPEARQFVEANREKLATIPVWLFSSGPIGWNDPKPSGPPGGIDELRLQTHARSHQVFAGRLDKGKLGFGERLVVKAVKSPEGDFRDWDAIRDWSRSIASALPTPAAART